MQVLLDQPPDLTTIDKAKAAQTVDALLYLVSKNRIVSGKLSGTHHPQHWGEFIRALKINWETSRGSQQDFRALLNAVPVNENRTQPWLKLSGLVGQPQAQFLMTYIDRHRETVWIRNFEEAHSGIQTVVKYAKQVDIYDRYLLTCNRYNGEFDYREQQNTLAKLIQPIMGLPAEQRPKFVTLHTEFLPEKFLKNCLATHTREHKPLTDEKIKKNRFKMREAFEVIQANMSTVKKNLDEHFGLKDNSVSLQFNDCRFNPHTGRRLPHDRFLKADDIWWLSSSTVQLKDNDFARKPIYSYKTDIADYLSKIGAIGLSEPIYFVPLLEQPDRTNWPRPNAI